MAESCAAETNREQELWESVCIMEEEAERLAELCQSLKMELWEKEKEKEVERLKFLLEKRWC